MRRVLPLAVFLIFFISNTIYSQVVIKEKVGIKPKYNSVSKSLAQHIISVDLKWDPIEVPAAILNYGDTGRYPCLNTGSTDWETGGNLSYQIIDAIGGYYNIQFRFGPPCNGQEEHARYSIYYDNDSVMGGTFTIGGCFSAGSFPYYNLVYKSPLTTDYSFQVYPKNLCVGEEGILYCELGSGCTNVEIDTSADNLNLQIVAGEKYVSFYRNGQQEGDNLNIPFSEIDDIDVIQDQFYSGNEIVVIIKSSVGDLIKYDSLLIYPKNRYRIDVSENTYPLLYDQNFYMEVHIMGPGGCLAKLPQGETLNAQIVKGNDFGYLQDLDNGTTGDTLNNIPLQSNGENHLEFISSGEMKADMDTAVIRLSISDEEINDVFVPVIFTPGPLVIDIQPPTLSPGETATITLKKRLTDGTIVDFDSTRTFEIGITDGCMLGNIVADNDTGVYFYDVPQPIKFVADTARDNSGEVKLRIAEVFEIILMNTKKNNKNTKGILTSKSDSRKNYDKTTGFCFGGNFKMNDASDSKIKIGSHIDTILLGETKYYQAKYPDPLSNKLIIEEVKPGSDGIPKLNGGLSDIWGDNPISIDTGKNYSKRMGVYWETEKPVWNGNTNKGNLEKGLIRIIGRYWSKDSTYVVTLKAKRENGDSAAIKINVVRPSKLLSSYEKYPYNKYIDVDSSAINIDTLCIIKGGKYGLPPNILKGQIFQETAKINRVFYPSYRYEPFSTQWDIYLQTWSGRFYFKDSLSVDYSDVPNHINVKYMNYIRKVKTVWDIIKDFSQLINQQNPSEYGRRNDDHSMDFNRKYFPNIQNKYDSFLNSFRMNIELTKIQVADSANKQMAKWFQNDWKNGKANKTIAQTRCASSYGLLQMLYTTAREKGYTKFDLPENLNNIKLFDNWLKYQVSLLYKNLKNKNNWIYGFEKTYKENVLAKWNKASIYSDVIFTNSLKFLPQR